MPVVGTLDLKAGEWIEVRSESEILATLADDGTLDGLPCMPEMLAHCGQRFQVYKRADKTCDTVNWTGLRRMDDTVHLSMLRCNGMAHGGCQAGCLMFWKEAWLRRSPPVDSVSRAADGTESFSTNGTAADSTNGTDARRVDPTVRIRAWLETTVLRNPSTAIEICYRCQATELLKASCPLRWWEPKQYVRDVRMNKLSLAEVARGLVFAAYSKVLRKLTGRPFPDVRGALKRTPSESLGLQSGEWVIIKSKEEILATLDTSGRNRGMTFDSEMLPYCGRRYRVLRRVERIIDETTGRLIEPAGVSIILEDVICMSRYRRSCPRSVYPFWREIWLRRASASETPENAASHAAEARL